MRAKDFLFELKTTRFDVRSTYYPSGREIVAYVDPSKDELISLSGYNPETSKLTKGLILRGLITDWQVIWWKMGDGIHLDIANALGVPGGDSSDENRRFKLFLNASADGPELACHESQLDHKWVQRMARSGLPINPFKR